MARERIIVSGLPSLIVWARASEMDDSDIGPRFSPLRMMVRVES